MTVAKKLLVVNVHYAPQSFGGATVLAENLAERLAQVHDWQVLAVSAVFDPTAVPYTVTRTRSRGVDVIGITMPRQLSTTEQYDNPNVIRIFNDIVSRFRPDVAHVHCLQNLGAGVLDVLHEQKVPTALTIHDCWWICEQQFMIMPTGTYCNQWKIDPAICAYCVVDAGVTRARNAHLRARLDLPDTLLFPSEFHRQLHLANGLGAERCVLNRNGIVPPNPGFSKKPDPMGRVRFGFVGGPGPIKGGRQIVQAFNAIEATNYELKVVDAAKNSGGTWTFHDWVIPGKMTVAPPYTRRTMDEFFGGLDVLLFPSQWKESFGLTVREAFARDVWVIATDAGGVVEDCVHGTNATVIPMDGSSHGLETAIRECLARTDWASYRNPLRDEIRTVDEQADELHGMLEALL